MVKKFIDVGKGLASLFRRTSEDKVPESVFQKNLIDTFGEDEVAEGIRIIGTSKKNPDLEKLFYKEGHTVEDDLVNLLEARYMGSTRLQAHPLSFKDRGRGSAERYLKLNQTETRLTDLPGGPGDKALYGKHYGEMTDNSVNNYYSKFNKANGFKRAPVLEEMADEVSLADAGKTIEGTAEPVFQNVELSAPISSGIPELKPLEGMVMKQMREMDDMLTNMKKTKADLDARAAFSIQEADELEATVATFTRMLDDGDEKGALEFLKKSLGKRTKNAKGGRVGMLKGGLMSLLKRMNPLIEKEMVKPKVPVGPQRPDAIGDMEQIKNISRSGDSGLEVFDEMYDMIQNSPRYEGAMQAAFMKLIDYEKFRAMLLDDNVKLQRMLKLDPEAAEGFIRMLFKKGGSEPSSFSQGGGVGTLFGRKTA